MSDDVVERIQSALDGTCGYCHGSIPEDSVSDAFCGESCQRGFHQDRAQNVGEIQLHPEAMYNWDPHLPIAQLPDDFVAVAHDEALHDEIPEVLLRREAVGSHNATVLRSQRRAMWHLRLDDGHRFVGRDLPDDALAAAPDQQALVEQIWTKLRRQLTDGQYAQEFLPRRAPSRPGREGGFHRRNPWIGGPPIYQDPRRAFSGSSSEELVSEGVYAYEFEEAVARRRMLGMSPAGDTVVPFVRLCVFCESSVSNNPPASDCPRCHGHLPPITFEIEGSAVSPVVTYTVRIGGHERLCRVHSPAGVSGAQLLAQLEAELVAQLRQALGWAEPWSDCGHGRRPGVDLTW